MSDIGVELGRDEIISPSYQETRDAEPRSLLGEFLVEHQRQLSTLPGTAQSYFTFPNLSTDLEGKYVSLDQSQVTELVRSWSMEGEMTRLEQQYGSRSIGAFIQSLTRLRGKDLDDAIDGLLTQTPNGSWSTEVSIAMQTLASAKDEISFSSHYMNQKAEVNVIDNEVDIKAKVALFRMGIIPDGLAGDLKGGFFTVVQLIGQQELPALAAYRESLFATGEVRDEDKIVAGGLLFTAELLNGRQTIDPDLFNDLKQVFVKVWSLGESEATEFSKLYLGYLYSDLPKDAMPEEVKSYVEGVSLDETQIVKSTLPEIVEECVLQHKTINPQSWVAELIKPESISEEKTGQLIKMALDESAGKWDQVNPFIAELIDQSIEQQGLTQGNFSQILTACVGFGIDFPPPVEKFLATPKGQELLSKTNLSVYKHRENNRWGGIDKYSNDPMQTILQKSFVSLPERLKQLLVDRLSQVDPNAFGRAWITKLFTSYGYFQEYFGERGKEQQLVDIQRRYWEIVHPEIWEIIGKMDGSKLLHELSTYFSYASTSLSLNTLVTGENGKLKYRGEQGLVEELLPSEILLKVQETAFPNHSLTGLQFSDFEQYRSFLSPAFVSTMPARQQKLIQLYLGGDQRSGGVFKALQFAEVNPERYLTIKDGQITFNADFIRSYINGRNVLSVQASNGSWLNGVSITLHILKETGFIDLSSKEAFSPEEAALFNFLSDPNRVGTLAARYVTIADDQVTFNTSQFVQDIDTTVNESGALLYGFKSSEAMKLLEDPKDATSRSVLADCLDLGLIDPAKLAPDILNLPNTHIDGKIKLLQNLTEVLGPRYPEVSLAILEYMGLNDQDRQIVLGKLHDEHNQASREGYNTLDFLYKVLKQSHYWPNLNECYSAAISVLKSPDYDLLVHPDIRQHTVNWMGYLRLPHDVSLSSLTIVTFNHATRREDLIKELFAFARVARDPKFFKEVKSKLKYLDDRYGESIYEGVEGRKVNKAKLVSELTGVFAKAPEAIKDPRIERFIVNNSSTLRSLSPEQVNSVCQTLSFLEDQQAGEQLTGVVDQLLARVVAHKDILSSLPKALSGQDLALTVIAKIGGFNQGEFESLRAVYQALDESRETKKTVTQFLVGAILLKQCQPDKVIYLLKNGRQLISDIKITSFVTDNIDTLSTFSSTELQGVFGAKELLTKLLSSDFAVIEKYLKVALDDPQFRESLFKVPPDPNLLPAIITRASLAPDDDPLLPQRMLEVFATLPEEYRSSPGVLKFLAMAKIKGSLSEAAKIIELGYEIIANPASHDVIWQNKQVLIELPPEKLRPYFEVFRMIDRSPSQEMQRLKFQLLGEILRTDDPVDSYRQIESIFIRNNLPLLGKVFKVFKVLYPPAILSGMLSSGSSPVLMREDIQRIESRRREAVVYRDLLKVHLLSGNLTLRSYLETLHSGANLLDQISVGEVLDGRETKRLTSILDKIDAFHASTVLGRSIEAHTTSLTSSAGLLRRVERLKVDLGLQPGQKIVDRLAEMFLRPAGLHTIDQALGLMEMTKRAAHARNLASVRESEDGKLTIATGDLLKGINQPEYLENILQNGSVSKEFVGADSDATPLDTDVSRVLEGDAKEGVSSAYSRSLARGYGNICLGIRDRGQFQVTRGVGAESGARYDPGKYELFCVNGVVGERHYGIRTGFASTEIDFILIPNKGAVSGRQLEKIYYVIAQNGFYIPVVNGQGEVLFTPEMYEEYRSTFDGIERYQGEPLRVERTNDDQKHHHAVQTVIAEVREDCDKVGELSDRIKVLVEEALGHKLKDEYDTGILGAELLNTGSSGRQTSVPGDYDFDMMLLLDNSDFPKVQSLVARLSELMEPAADQSHPIRDRGDVQLKFKGVKHISDSPIDLDIGMVSKSELHVFGSHEAIEAKLRYIKDYYGEDAYWEVVGNIVLAKKILKAGHAYKKVDHGGFGGIGTENWILAHGGNLLAAMRSFKEAAYENGQRVTLQQFREKYKLYDAGVNLRDLDHDNYIANLTEQGYQAMLKTIEDYLIQEVVSKS